jgi:F-box-like
MTRIDRLPDNVLLEIFDFCKLQVVDPFFYPRDWNRIWNMLTRVCRRWRYIVLGSPRRLDLRIFCTATTPTRMLLDIWPPFPISIYGTLRVNEGVENLTAALEHRDRISQICIYQINGPGLERLIGAMHEPLPALIHFDLASTDEPVPMLHETLGGSAPCLKWFILSGIPFPTFPKFILSATHIVYLVLFDIPNSGYISPEVMATCLAALPNLNHLALGFRSPLSRHLQVGLPPLSRVVLPALTSHYFKGASEYFEDFLARTHIPLLNSLYMQLFMDLIFDIPRTRQFIDRAEGLRPLNHAWVRCDLKRITINLGIPTRIQLDILCEERDWQLSSLAHVCHQFLPLSSVEQLTVCELYPDAPLNWEDDMDPSQWLELFHPFIAVRDLCVAKQFVPFVTAALQDLTGERTMEVLPVLNNLSLEGFEAPGPVQQAIKPFVSARQISGHPIFIQSESPPLSRFIPPEDE